MTEKLTEFGETYEEHVKRVAQIFHDMDRADIEKDRPVIPGIPTRTRSSQRMLDAMLTVELIGMAQTNPNLSEEQRLKELDWLEKINDEEVQERLKLQAEKDKQDEENRKKWFTQE